eukprot:scaffold126132_cov21-Tisochrysis_lutea.AAC.1
MLCLALYIQGLQSDLLAPALLKRILQRLRMGAHGKVEALALSQRAPPTEATMLACPPTQLLTTKLWPGTKPVSCIANGAVARSLLLRLLRTPCSVCRDAVTEASLPALFLKNMAWCGTSMLAMCSQSASSNTRMHDRAGEHCLFVPVRHMGHVTWPRIILELASVGLCKAVGGLVIRRACSCSSALTNTNSLHVLHTPSTSRP